jgi:hypothetical protein
MAASPVQVSHDLGSYRQGITPTLPSSRSIFVARDEWRNCVLAARMVAGGAGEIAKKIDKIARVLGIIRESLAFTPHLRSVQVSRLDG